MPFALAYWIIMLIWLLFGLYSSGIMWLTGPNVILFILLVLLGWKVFGVPLHG
jgi:hypothetical protein